MQRTRGSLRGLVVGCLLIAVVASACTSRRRADVGGVTHWLTACDVDADCGDGSCLCGLCTRPCAGDSECGGQARAASCYDLRSPGLTDTCGTPAQQQSGGVCLGICKRDADCVRGSTCFRGVCVAEPPATKQSVGAGCGGDAVCPPQDACAAGGCSPPAISPISLLGTDAGVDFAQPLHLTPPATIITGDSEALLGHWVPDPDKNCSVECLHLLIERDPGSGATIGHVYFVAVPVGATLGPIHFAPASDPGVGYPRELQPGQYNDARSEGVDEQRYRLFDGKVEGDRFTVWWSWLDLWSDWCALQTPQRVKVADETRYVCAPSVDDPSIDLGKRVLCTSADMSAACDGGPCVCAEDPSGDRSPLCSTTYCQCDASSCEANPWSEPRWLDLTRVGDRLEGVERNGLDGSPWRAVAFTKSGAP